MEIEIAGKTFEITDEMVIEYTLAEFGEKIGLYPDESYAVGDAIGSEIAEDERPIFTLKCPGIGNISTSWYASGWATWDNTEQDWIETETGKHMSTEEMIRRCIVEGDGQPHENLAEDLQNAYKVLQVD